MHTHTYPPQFGTCSECENVVNLQDAEQINPLALEDGIICHNCQDNTITKTTDDLGRTLYLRHVIDQEINEAMVMWYEISLDQDSWYPIYAYWFDGLSEFINANFVLGEMLEKVAAELENRPICEIQAAAATQSGWAIPIKG